jgi:hypothetical protein
MRVSELPVETYLDTLFDTGTERQHLEDHSRSERARQGSNLRPSE